MKKVKITIEGMHCASCTANVEKALSKIPGVKNAKVNLLFKKATADIEDSITEEQLKKAVEDAGYRAVKVELL